MADVTTIQVKKPALEELKEIKQYPRQTYSDLILELARVYKACKMKNQYDEFLHKIQQEKMAELWDNREDEDWENV